MRIMNKVCFSLILLLLLGSCIPQKKIIYMQDKTSEKGYQNEYQKSEVITESYKVKPGDYIYIRINSTKEEINNLYNLGGSAMSSMNMTSGGSMKYYSYVVKDNGSIDFPFIGDIDVKGKTLSIIKEELHALLSKSIDSFSLQVMLANNNFTIVGEVNNPGQYTMSREQISLYEAIGIAGDVTAFGKRTRVRIIRPTENGSTTITADLTDKNLLDSQNYFILPNDLIYIEPMAAKQLGIGDTFSFNMISWVLSVAVLINTFKK